MRCDMFATIMYNNKEKTWRMTCSKYQIMHFQSSALPQYTFLLVPVLRIGFSKRKTWLSFVLLLAL